MKALPSFSPPRGARAVLAAALVFSALIASGQQGQPPRQPPSLQEKTSEAFTKLKPLEDAKNWDAIIAILDSIPSVGPTSYDRAMIENTRGGVYLKKDEYSKVIAPWETVVELADAHGYFDKRQTLLLVGILAQLHAIEGTTVKDPAAKQMHFTKAISHYKRVLAETPNPTAEVLGTYASILYYKATADPANIDQPLMKEARAAVETALRSTLNPKEGMYQLLLTIQQQQNETLASTDLLELLVKMNPKSQNYWRALMGSYINLQNETKNENRQREFLLRTIVTIERAQAQGFLTEPSVNMNLVSFYLIAGQFSQGTAKLYDGLKTGKIESTPQNWRLLGRFYGEANQPARAVEVLEEAAKLFPTNGDIEYQIALLHYGQERTQKVLEHCQRAMTKGVADTKTRYEALKLIAFSAFELGEIDQASKAITEAAGMPESKQDQHLPRLKKAIDDAILERELKNNPNPAPAAPSV